MKRPLRVVVTGAAGFIGSHVAEHFLSKGDRVTALDNLSRSRYLGYAIRGRNSAWDRLKRYPQVTRIAGDVRCSGDLETLFSRGADLVVHTAGQVGVRESLNRPLLDCSINVLGTLRLLEATRRRAPQATVIFCSTNKVYGSSLNARPIRETRTRYLWKGMRGISEAWPIDRSGHTPYGVSKLSADLYVQEYAHSYGLRTATFRMSCVYGERQFGMADQGWVAWMALAILKGWPITIYGNGKQVRDLLHADDLARLCEVYYKSSCGPELFNVGGGPRQAVSVMEVLTSLERLCGRSAKMRSSKERLHDQRIYVSDIRRAQRLLGWTPRIGVEEGLRRLTGWLKRNLDLFVKET